MEVILLQRIVAHAWELAGRFDRSQISEVNRWFLHALQRRLSQDLDFGFPSTIQMAESLIEWLGSEQRSTLDQLSSEERACHGGLLL